MNTELQATEAATQELFSLMDPNHDLCLDQAEFYDGFYSLDDQKLEVRTVVFVFAGTGTSVRRRRIFRQTSQTTACMDVVGCLSCNVSASEAMERRRSRQAHSIRSQGGKGESGALGCGSQH